MEYQYILGMQGLYPSRREPPALTMERFERALYRGVREERAYRLTAYEALRVTGRQLRLRAKGA